MAENCHEKLIKKNFLKKRVAELNRKIVCAIDFDTQINQPELISVIQLFTKYYIPERAPTMFCNKNITCLSGIWLTHFF